MKNLNLKNVKVEVLFSQKKEMKDSKTGKEVVWFENTILCPDMFEGTEKATSSAEIKRGPSVVEMVIRPSETELKLKIIGQTENPAKK